VRNSLDRALLKNPGYPPGCSPRDVDGEVSELRRRLLTAETQRRGEEEIGTATRPSSPKSDYADFADEEFE